MWIAMTDGFVSVVEDSENSSRLVVRARKKHHLTNFFGSESYKIVEDVKGERDYRYRAFASREQVARIVSKKILGIRYDNFKAMTEVKDKQLAKMYHLWWYDHYKLQENNRNRKPWAKYPKHGSSLLPPR